MSRYAKWMQAERGAGVRFGAMLLAGVFFLALLPLLVVVVGRSLDRLVWPAGFKAGAANWVLGGAMMVAGCLLAWWAIAVQLTRGRGTPLPMLPTQELLTGGPFRYCRNPMTLGTLLAYVGLGIVAATVAGTGMVLGLVALLLAYLKRVEEKELAERFGDPYLAYMRSVPFIIPRRPTSSPRDHDDT